MINEQFKLKYEVEGKEKEITVVMQEISPFLISDMTSECLNTKGNNILPGEYIKLAIENGLIVSPKNLMEEIEKADEPIAVIGKLFGEVNSFSASPRKYKLQKVQEKSKEQSKSMEPSNS